MGHPPSGRSSGIARDSPYDILWRFKDVIFVFQYRDGHILGLHSFPFYTAHVKSSTHCVTITTISSAVPSLIGLWILTVTEGVFLEASSPTYQLFFNKKQYFSRWKMNTRTLSHKGFKCLSYYSQAEIKKIE